jgi:hypothetical protein
MVAMILARRPTLDVIAGGGKAVLESGLSLSAFNSPPSLVITLSHRGISDWSVTAAG